MKGLHCTTPEKGQALTELAIVLPALVLFMSLVLPLSLRGVLLPWMDERLYLRQVSSEDHLVRSRLREAHSTELLPAYFEEGEIEDSSVRSSLGISLPIPGFFFPGEISVVTSEASPDWTRGWNRKVLGSVPEKDRKVARSLAMVRLEALGEDQLPGAVRRWSLVGLTGGSVDLLKRAGISVFHINLDALPCTGAGDGTGEDRP